MKKEKIYNQIYKWAKRYRTENSISSCENIDEWNLLEWLASKKIKKQRKKKEKTPKDPCQIKCNYIAPTYTDGCDPTPKQMVGCAQSQNDYLESLKQGQNKCTFEFKIVNPQCDTNEDLNKQ